jgi:S-(hydroxymethyl)glutathione dehydrogenase/alcohol dehydrogenase
VQATPKGVLMRAAILRDDSGTLNIEDVTIDKPDRNEVLIKTVASGLCHSDLHFIDGSWSFLAMYPMLLGHEAAGVVQAIGEDVVGIQTGDHVITCLSMFCGYCERCLTGHSYICSERQQVQARQPGNQPRIIDNDGAEVNQFTGIGSFGEEMLVHQNGVVKISNDMPLDRAALIGCGVTTGVGAVFRSAEVKPGSTVAVVGCGGVGISTIQGAHLAGARQIIAVDLEQQKLDWATQLGATHTVNPNDGDPVAQVLELTSGGVDYSFEAIGLKQTAEQAYGMIRAGGLATIMGMVPPGVNLEIDGADLFLSAKRLQGSIMGSNNFKVDMPHLCDLYLGGRLKLDEMVSRTITLDEINDGFTAMKNGEVVRAVIDFGI